MSEPTVYRPGVSARPRRKEKVILPGGENYLWVREMSVADAAQILERSAGQTGGNGTSGRSASLGVVLQIMLSCYDSDSDDAQRIFSDADFGAIYSLPYSDFDAIYTAMNRVNGKEPTEQERLHDFLTVTQAASNS